MKGLEGAGEVVVTGALSVFADYDRIGDTTPPPAITEFDALATRTADGPVPLPTKLPAQTPKLDVPRHEESSVYPYLHTNVEWLPMQFSQEPFPTEVTEETRLAHGSASPFRHWQAVKGYVADLFNRNGYSDLVSYNTTVERAEKIGEEWKVTLRRDGEKSDYWWVEWFDAVVVASGHYWVPYIPAIKGLEAFEKARPGSVIHSKHFRGRDLYQGKRVLTVGASVSAADIAVDLVNTAALPVHAVMVGRTFNGYFGDEAFKHPKISQHPTIERIEGRTVHFEDGTSVADVDHIIFGTGYSWTLPFLPQVPVRNNRVPDLYQHVVWRHDPTLLFIGAVGAGLTFKVFEWQAVLAARLLAGRASLPPVEEQLKWEEDRIRNRGDGPKFLLIYPDFEEYFETLREFAGPGENGLGRQLPRFKSEWYRSFMEGHDKRKAMWRRLNAEAARESRL